MESVERVAHQVKVVVAVEWVMVHGVAAVAEMVLMVAPDDPVRGDKKAQKEKMEPSVVIIV